MPTQNSTDPLMPGTVVRIRLSGYHRAKIAEYLGPLGPKGARVYRVLVQRKPRRTYIEVLEEQLEVLKEPRQYLTQRRARVIPRKDLEQRLEMA